MILCDVLNGVAVLVPGLDGLGRVPAARGRAVALARRAPGHTGVSTLTGGHPSRKHEQAGVAGVDDDSGPFPCPGIAGLISFTLRVNEARLANCPGAHALRCTALRCRALRPAQIATPVTRQARCRAAEGLKT